MWKLVPLNWKRQSRDCMPTISFLLPAMEESHKNIKV